MTVEPKRMAVDPETSAALKDALQSMRATGPSSAELARMSVSLGLGGPTMQAGGTSATADAAKAAALGGIGIVKLGAVLTTVLAAIGVGTWMIQKDASEKATPSRVVSVAEPPSVSPEKVGLPTPPAEPDPLIEDKPTPVEVKSKPRRHRTTQPVTTTPTPVVEAIPPPPPAPDLSAQLREEAALIQRAEKALAARPAEALRLLTQHRQRFAQGTLAQEREVITIDALLRLGRRGEAERRASAFLAAHPGSLHARRVERLLSAP